MNSKPVISIIIPVYNAETYLKRCLKSINEQIYKNFEVLIIDDGSIDRSKQIYKGFESKDKRFVSFKQENKGPSAARNLGIENAKGEFIAFIDADDYIDKNYLQELINTIQVNKADLTCCGYYELSNFHKKPYPVIDFSLSEPKDKNQFIHDLFRGTSGVLWAKLFRSKVIRNNNLLLDPNIKMSEDLIFVLDYTLKINKIAILDKYLYFYNRLNEKGISSQHDLSYIKDLELSNGAIRSIIKSNNWDFPEIDNFIKNRIGSLLLLLSNKIVLSSKKHIEIKTKLKQVLSNEYIKNHIYELKSNKIQDQLSLFFLKKNWHLFYSYYCKIIAIAKQVKRKFR